MRRSAQVRRLAALLFVVNLLTTSCGITATAPQPVDGAYQQPVQTGIMLAGATDLSHWTSPA